MEVTCGIYMSYRCYLGNGTVEIWGVVARRMFLNKPFTEVLILIVLSSLFLKYELCVPGISFCSRFLKTEIIRDI